MSIFGKKEKAEIEALNAEISKLRGENTDLKAKLSPELQEYADISEAIIGERKLLYDLKRQTADMSARLEMLNKEVIETDETVLLQSFGFYTPHYSYATSDEYREKLKVNRERQKRMIKIGTAVRGNAGWAVNGSTSQGSKMVKDMQKLLLRAFNAECDDAIEHVRFNNIDAAENRIIKSAQAISKLGAVMEISITEDFLEMKLFELRLMHEYQVKKQEEKDEAKEATQRQREEEKAARELEEARKKLEKEQLHYENALSNLTTQLENTENEEQRKELLLKKAEIETRLEKIDAEMKDVDYRAANQKAGYVYIISNIGAFGEDIYKIGMTRRLEPMDRVDELGDASVPFNFDVHAMIFTDDAPGLEAALHNAFADRKLNFVNQRREFFNVTLGEIKEVVRKNYDKTVEFVDVAPAEQYRESLKLRSMQV